MASQIPWQEIQKRLREPNGSSSSDFDEWLSESQENQQIWEELKVVYNISGNTPEYFIPHKEKAWSDIESRLKAPKVKVRRLTNWMRIAASFLLVALGVGGTLLLSPSEKAYTETYSPYGHKTLVLLPDSSEIWLNGNSRVRYQTDFTSNRQLELTGEALFKVRKDPHHPFTVHASKLDLKVYGTTFNVRAYPDDQENEVALLEGSVGVFKGTHLLTNMKPGDVVTYHVEDNKFFMTKEDIRPIISWNSDELVIEDKSFDEVAKYLERWYGVSITLDPELNKVTQLSFKVKTESLQELLSIISRITPVTYRIQGKEVWISKK